MTIEQEIKLQARYLAQDMAKDMAKDMAQDIAKDMAQDIAKDMAQDIAKDMAQDIANEKTLETAKNLLKINISPEQIAMATGLSLEQVTSLKTDKN